MRYEDWTLVTQLHERRIHMKGLVVSDEQGNILAMGKPEEIVDEPTELELGSLDDPYASGFGLDLKGDRARLVSVGEFIEPLTKKNKKK
jgi:hypothetical protein